MLIAFRVDASLRMGTGHVMRCLALAEALRQRGDECDFVCRRMNGDLIELIGARGHAVAVLPPGQGGGEGPPHASWLESDWQTDAVQTAEALAEARPDWLVTDHYALDARWEAALRLSCDHMLVLDDLTDRTHDCDLLLDQTFGRDVKDYRGLTPQGCHVMAGAQYALLRPDFARLRQKALARRGAPVRRVLVSLGGVDPGNCTLDVLKALETSRLPEGCQVTAVMTDRSVWLDAVRAFAARARMPVEVLCNVADMAWLMADADIAVGAGGTTSWERCCLGLPTLLVVIAENQRTIAGNLAGIGAVTVIARNCIAGELPAAFESLGFDAPRRIAMAQAAAAVTDGAGCALVAGAMHQITAGLRMAPARMGGHVA